MPAERIIRAVRDAIPGLGRTNDCSEVKGSNGVKDTMAGRLGLEKERAYRNIDRSLTGINRFS
jgi:hypothetical protein